MKFWTLCLSLGVPVLFAAAVLHVMLMSDVAYFENGILKFDKLEKLQASIPGKNCKRYHSDLPGEYDSEDVVRYSDDLFIFPGGDIHTAFQFGWKKAKKDGQIFLLDLKKGKTLVAERRNWPKKRPFHSHGVYLSKLTNRYYVINHSGLKKEYSVIEVFNVIRGENDEYPIFDYVGAINAGFRNGVINDIIENGEDEIFVTQWKAFPIPLNGEKGRKGFWELIDGFKHLLSQLSQNRMFAMTAFHYCRFDINDLSKKAECVEANGDFGYLAANGITIDRTKEHKNTIYVTDPPMKHVNVYEVPKRIEIKSFQQKNAIIRQVKHIGTIETPDALDNLDFDETKQVITTAGIPSAMRFLQFMEDHKTLVPGTMVEIDPKTWKVERKFYHDGSLLNELASCVYNSDKARAKAVCGSPFSPGVLVCDVEL